MKSATFFALVILFVLSGCSDVPRVLGLYDKAAQVMLCNGSGTIMVPGVDTTRYKTSDSLTFVFAASGMDDQKSWSISAEPLPDTIVDKKKYRRGQIIEFR